jgi:hypothetical protein
MARSLLNLRLLAGPKFADRILDRDRSRPPPPGVERPPARKSKDKPPPRWKRELGKGSVRDTFIVGALLSFPGASYIAGMDLLSKQKIGVLGGVLAVLPFNAIMFLLLELPLIGYATRPQSTAAAVQRFRHWLSSRGGRIALIGAAVIGLLMIGRGLLNL